MKKTFLKPIALVLAVVLLFFLLVGCQPPLPEKPTVIYDTISVITQTSEIVTNTDVIVVGTVLSAWSKSVRLDNGEERWMTFSKVRVEESLHGNVKRGQVIEVHQEGAPGRQLYRSVENGGSFFQAGERLVLFLYPMNEVEAVTRMYDLLLQPGKERNAYGTVDPYSSALKVDSLGNLSHRCNPKEIFEKGLPLEEYKTLTELRNALPQLLKEEKPTRVAGMYLDSDSFKRNLQKAEQIVIGTVTELEFRYIRLGPDRKDWYTLIKMQVEESLHGSVTKGQTIEFYMYGAPGKEITEDLTYNRVVYYPAVGERLLMCLKTAQKGEIASDEYKPNTKLINKLIDERHLFKRCSTFNSMMTVDSDGFIRQCEHTKQLFATYKTVTELKGALPQLQKDWEEWIEMYPFEK